MSNSKTAAPVAKPSDISKRRSNDELHYDAATSFSDPLPKDRDLTSITSDSDEEGLALRKNPFLDPDVAEYWAVTYEKSQYECRHVFDPTFTWTEEEERKLVRRLDWRVCLWAVGPPLSSIMGSRR
jgi:hypothetical protein